MKHFTVDNEWMQAIKEDNARREAIESYTPNFKDIEGWEKLSKEDRLVLAWHNAVEAKKRFDVAEEQGRYGTMGYAHHDQCKKYVDPILKTFMDYDKIENVASVELKRCYGEDACYHYPSFLGEALDSFRHIVETADKPEDIRIKWKPVYYGEKNGSFQGIAYGFCNKKEAIISVHDSHSRSVEPFGAENFKECKVFWEGL